jgi:hypothetical protein
MDKYLEAGWSRTGRRRTIYEDVSPKYPGFTAGPEKSTNESIGL